MTMTHQTFWLHMTVRREVFSTAADWGLVAFVSQSQWKIDQLRTTSRKEISHQKTAMALIQ